MSRYLLIVDDDPDIRELSQLILEGYGHAVATAEDAVHALELLDARGPPALILLDLRMPGLSGEELLPLLRRRYGRSVPVVVLSGDASARVTARNAGADGFLAKPVGVRELLDAVQTYAAEEAHWAH